MYLDRTRNWDYNPHSTNPFNGTLHGDHAAVPRDQAVMRGLPIGLPDRLLHGVCNIQRGNGGNDHLAAIASSNAPVDTSKLAMPWPW
jgi:hypothetical protein